jgi:uncharacterized protein (DUF169 family)
MESAIAKCLKLKYQPVAVLFTNERPEHATQFAEGRWGCVGAMHTAAANGRTVVFDRKTYGCPGGAIGLGLSRTMGPGMAEFLSTGNSQREGEGFWKGPEEAQAFIDRLPAREIPETFVVFKPLADVDEAEAPRLVNFYANPDQLSALVVLANYGRRTAGNVVAEMAAGCHTICLLPLAEDEREVPRAVLGMFDITARVQVDADILSFSVPFRMFKEMEANVPGSFLEKHDWEKVRARIPDAPAP